MTFIEALPHFLGGATIRRRHWRNDTRASMGEVDVGGQAFATVKLSCSGTGNSRRSRHENGFDLYDIMKNDWELVDESEVAECG